LRHRDLQLSDHLGPMELMRLSTVMSRATVALMAIMLSALRVAHF
jgi:hypothetical protein